MPRREASWWWWPLSRAATAASTVDATEAAAALVASVAWLPSMAFSSGMVRMTSTVRSLAVRRRRLARPAASVARISKKHAGSRHDSSFLRLVQSIVFSGEASKEATVDVHQSGRSTTKASSKETTVEATG